MSHWAIIAFAAMTGKIGKPGEGVGFSWHYGGGGMPVSGKRGAVGIPQGRNPAKGRCPASRISEMLLNPGKPYPRDGSNFTFPDVHMIYNAGNNFVHHQQNTNELIDAMAKKVHTVVNQDPWWCASSRYADIVLPATSHLERDDISTGGTYSNDKIWAMRQVIQPYGESLDDFEIFRRLAELFGVEYGFTEGLTVMDIVQEELRQHRRQDPLRGVLGDRRGRDGGARYCPPLGAPWRLLRGPGQEPAAHRHRQDRTLRRSLRALRHQGMPADPEVPRAGRVPRQRQAGPGAWVSPHPFMRVHSQMANAECASTSTSRAASSRW